MGYVPPASVASTKCQGVSVHFHRDPRVQNDRQVWGTCTATLEFRQLESAVCDSMPTRVKSD